MRISLDVINHMDKQTMVDKLGWIFEHSPWIIEQAWEARPFQSGEQLMRQCKQIVERSELGKQLELIRAHPDLAGRLKMTEASVQEQHGAGLDKLSSEEYEAFKSCNQAYKEKFDIPFIIAVRGHDKQSIISNLRKRIDGDKEEERALALAEIFKIARLRLDDLIEGEPLV
jgi:OHCU decarboxylase